MREALTETIIFSTVYCITFLALIHTFSDGGQTTGMFVIIGLFTPVLLTVYYIVASFILQAFKKKISLLTKVFLLFIIAELAALTLTGELPLFGLLQKYIYSGQPYSGNKWLDNSIYVFREKRDFAFSMSAVAGSIIVLIAKMRTKK